jgi:CheY-like chemotaxis protein
VQNLKDYNILVVDDEDSLRKAIVFDFKRKGFNVIDAENGKQAFEIVKNSRIDVVLTDVRMPGGDGIELLDNIKELNCELPVVMFITGYADITLEEAYDKGVDAVFAKPFDRKALFEAVLRAISQKTDKWNSRKLERIETDFSIDIEFPELNLAIQGRVMNIGRGGVFISLKDNFPTVDTKTNFNIKFKDGIPTNLIGTGMVRWVRTQECDGRSSGCGIEFDFLDDYSRGQIVTLINSIKTKAFIPKN